jgi:P pilus assembly chaperone PapD
MSKIVVFFCLLMGLSTANAFSVSPSAIHLSPTGRDSMGSYFISNKGGNELIVSVFLTEMSYDEKGKETRNEFDVKKNFLVMPANLMIKPGGTANIKIVYIGPKDVKAEKLYRVTIANVKPQSVAHFGTGEVKASVNIMFSYSQLLYVAPADAKPIVEFTNLVDKDGGVSFQVENKGTKSASLAKRNFLIKAKNLEAPEKYSGSAFPSLFYSVLPGQKRVLIIPADSKADKKSATIELANE